MGRQMKKRLFVQSINIMVKAGDPLEEVYNSITLCVQV